MKTYQDFELIQDEASKMQFVLDAIREHKASRLYLRARDTQKYYEGENVTISRYEKIIYDAMGIAKIDRTAPNHKLKTAFFQFVVDQLVSYLLGNGVQFDDRPKKITEEFDLDLVDLATAACIGGVAFGYPELQPAALGEQEQYKLRVFSVTEFVPLYDENTGELRAGIRFWQVDYDKPLRATLYEQDGYTEYLKPDDGNIRILKPFQTYKQIIKTSVMDGTVIAPGEPFPGFPIIPLKYNEKMFSAMHGNRATIDAYDLLTSGLVNDVDEGTLLYWAVKGYGGMDEENDANWLDVLRRTKIAHVDMEGDAEPHTVEAPVQSTQTAIDMLNKKLYTDFQAFDASAVSAGNQTATAIKASYVPLDLKTDKFEKQVTKFILGILRIIGESAKPSYTRNKIINATEEIQSVLMTAEYLDDEYITKKVLSILGDSDQFEEIQKRKEESEMERFNQPEQQPEQQPEETTNPVDDQTEIVVE